MPSRNNSITMGWLYLEITETLLVLRVANTSAHTDVGVGSNLQDFIYVPMISFRMARQAFFCFTRFDGSVVGLRISKHCTRHRYHFRWHRQLRGKKWVQQDTFCRSRPPNDENGRSWWLARSSRQKDFRAFWDGVRHIPINDQNVSTFSVSTVISGDGILSPKEFLLWLKKVVVKSDTITIRLVVFVHIYTRACVCTCVYKWLFVCLGFSVSVALNVYL